MCFTSCKDSDDIAAPEGGYADLVVYGSVYTSEDDALAEGFAVRDGKYVCVGTMEEVAKYVGDKTQVISHGDATVMAGCTEGHGHYITEAAFKQLCYIPSSITTVHDCLKFISDWWKDNSSKSQLFGYGWYWDNFDDTDKAKVEAIADSLEEICPGKPVFICDREMHQGWVNRTLLEKAGLWAADGKTISGGTIYRREAGALAGYPTGRVQDQACGYVRLKALEPLMDEAGYEAALATAQTTLLSMGYTNYLDAWLSYDNSDYAYQALNKVDTKDGLHLNVVGCYEIDSYKITDDAAYQKEVATALDWKKYSHTHFQANSIKLFADGCTESFQGYVKSAYPKTGNCGSQNWKDDALFKRLVTYINAQGLLVHTHAYGDAAVAQVIDAYEYSNKQNNASFRNGIGHAASVDEPELERLAQNGNISVAENFCWHSYFATGGYTVDDIIARFNQLWGMEFFKNMYPMNSFFKRGIKASSSTDAPCSSGFASDPFGIIENMLTGVNPVAPATPRNTAECCSLIDALNAMTINGAWQLGLEDERGSIAVGKYADFLLLDHNLFKTAPTALHNVKVEQTWFEGKKVYEQ